MKILHTADWHLGKTLEKIDRIEEQKEFIDEICQISIEEKIDLILITGDIFDTYNPPSQAEYLFYKSLEKLNDNSKRAVVVIAGNHDSPDRLCAINPLVKEKGIFLVGYPGYKVEESICENIKLVNRGSGWFELNFSTCRENTVICALPYPSEQRLDEILTNGLSEVEMQKAYSEKVRDILWEAGKNFRENTVNIIASHIFVVGGQETGGERPIQVGGAYTVDTKVFPKNTHYVALGHLHGSQKIKGNSEIRYSGSPLSYSFSDVNSIKSINIINIEEPDFEVKVEVKYLKSGKPLKCWKAKNGIAEVFKWCEEGRDKNAWIDLEIFTDRIIKTEEHKKLKSMNPGIINIRPIIINDLNDIKKYEERQTKKIDELFKQFYKYKTGIEAKEEIVKLFLDIIND
jgi:exonuclease SbcD